MLHIQNTGRISLCPSTRNVAKGISDCQWGKFANDREGEASETVLRKAQYSTSQKTEKWLQYIIVYRLHKVPYV